MEFGDCFPLLAELVRIEILWYSLVRFKPNSLDIQEKNRISSASSPYEIYSCNDDMFLDVIHPAQVWALPQT